jgi:glycine/D-amino acid oxidase-like deaminating enzyme
VLKPEVYPPKGGFFVVLKSIMKNTNQPIQDLIIIGGGIMGLMTAYYASFFVKNITILEKNVIGKENKEAASFSFTRSIRTDYIEPLYARLAYESQLLWTNLENKTAKEFFIKCGCLNIAKRTITPDFASTYAEKSYQNILDLNFQPEKLNKREIKKRFPQFKADMGRFDTKGGFLFLPAITNFLLSYLKKKKIVINESVEIDSIEENANSISLKTDKGNFTTKKIVITAGKGTNNLLSKIANNKLSFPITYVRPQRKYYYPTKEIAKLFLPERFPVFAYTDVGIYGHPIFDKKKGAVKVAYFVPVGTKQDDSKITCVEDFVNECLPILKNVPSEEIKDADNCWYDIVSDDDFILGKLPRFKNIFIGTGWRGTGYKFAPLIGKILCQLALQKGTVYDIQKFSPARFIK